MRGEPEKFMWQGYVYWFVRDRHGVVAMSRSRSAVSRDDRPDLKRGKTR